MADTGFLTPSATGHAGTNDFTTPENAYASDNSYAVETTNGHDQDYYNFSLGIPAGATDFSVEVTLEGLANGTIVINGDNVAIKVDLSIDGSTYGTKIQRIFAVGTSEQTQTWGGSSTAGDGTYWGLTFTEGGFSDANFRARVEMDRRTGGATGFSLDQIRVKVYYTEAATGTNMQINVGDVWKAVPAAKINVGDVWKDVAGIQINVGDVWKTVF